MSKWEDLGTLVARAAIGIDLLGFQKFDKFQRPEKYFPIWGIALCTSMKFWGLIHKSVQNP